MISRSLVRLEYADTRDVVYEAFRHLRLLTEMDEQNRLAGCSLGKPVPLFPRIEISEGV